MYNASSLDKIILYENYFISRCIFEVSGFLPKNRLTVRTEPPGDASNDVVLCCCIFSWTA